MYSSEIEAVINKVPKMRNLFTGVYSCDRIPKSRRKQFALIVNTHTHEKKGEHWQLIHVQGDTCHFFCSLGRRPNRHISRFLSKYHVTRNKSGPQQSHEYTCGGYCIFVMDLLARGHAFTQICKIFDTIKQDDMFIRTYMQQVHAFDIVSY